MTNSIARNALITGAAGGIGRAIALRLAHDGYDIGVVDINQAGSDETAGLVRELGRRAAVAVSDVSQRDSARAAVASVVAALGPLDVLVNNAGILRNSKFVDITEADWRATMSVNLDSVFHFSQAVLPAMIERRSGCIVNMSSWTGKRGAVNHGAYSATKAAVIALTQSVGAELADTVIRVNAVCPGTIVETQMRVDAEAQSKKLGLPDLDTRVRTAIPMRRAGTPSEVANVVAFLVSDDASYMTGQAINISGGLWMN
jgi:NAD(P)-dependent dehydrogenase (short-subunit alcohol dehydrogenase family)